MFPFTVGSGIQNRVKPRVLTFFEQLQGKAAKKTKIWVRIPLIPGYNDSEENLHQVAEFVKPLMSVEKVGLLPYNKAASAKYQFIGKKYGLEHLVPHSEEEMAAFVEIFSRLGMRAERR